MTARATAIATVLLALLILTPAAQAGWLNTALVDCGQGDIEQPFTHWLDPFSYVLAPEGGFEDGAASWKLAGGAAPASGNEPWKVGGSTDSRSLSIPAGGSATSPATCIGIDRPLARLFSRRTGGGLLGLGVLSVDVIYQDASGNTLTLPLTPVVATSSWAPSLPIPILANLVPQLDGAATIALRFRAVGAAFQIDDVYVDPYVKH